MKIFNFLLVLLTFAFLLLSLPSGVRATHATCASIPVSGSYTVPVSTTCSFGGAVDGVDGSTLTAGTDTGNNANIILNTTSLLQVGGPSGATDLTSQVVGWGGTLTIPTGGSVVIRNGASMKQGPLWLPDADGDKYPDAVTMSSACTTSAGCFYATRPSTSQFRRYYLTGVSGQTTFTYTSDMTADCSSSTTGTCPSAPPSGLGASAFNQTRIDLTWTASTDSSTTGYKIYRCAGSGCTPIDVSITVTPGSAASYSNTGLTCGTLYRYKLFATNSAGTSTTDSGFAEATTSSCVSAPTVTTPTGTSILATTATLGANVTSNGGAALTARGTCWGTTAAPTTNCLAEGLTTTGIFTHSRTALTAGALLYYRGYATNSQGTSYSSDGSFYTEPATQASSVTFSSVTQTGMTVNWTRGSGDGVIVLMKSGSAVNSDPVDGTYTTYTASTTFGSGTQIGTGNYVIYKSTGTSVAVTGLTASTTYYVAVYEYKGTVNTSGDAQGTNYKGTPATGSQATAAACSSNGSTCSVGGDCCSGNCYVDADGDTYAPATGTKTCKAAAATAGTDCYDSNANAKPGQTTYYSTNRGDASFDYNCDSSATGQYYKLTDIRSVYTSNACSAAVTIGMNRLVNMANECGTSVWLDNINPGVPYEGWCTDGGYNPCPNCGTSIGYRTNAASTLACR